ncbi:hypothetical protein FOA52_016110 [Chlamydomonas sp. UWO 241]|nr:hypothetical protein FOA52_016110 [Chlamydomonas sp. UWO 241]
MLSGVCGHRGCASSLNANANTHHRHARHAVVASAQRQQQQQQKVQQEQGTSVLARGAAAGPGARLAAGAASAALSATLLLGAFVAPPPADAITTQQLLFLEAWRAVDRAYVDKGFNGQSWFRIREKYLKQEPMDNRDQTYAAIMKLLASLDDPFTRFLPPDRLQALRRGTSGSVTGVGVEVTYPPVGSGEKALRVVTPIPGGSADAAGVKAGDSIVSIDGTSTEGLSLYEASDLLLGAPNSEIVLSVRSGTAPPKTLTLTRRAFIVPPVNYSMCGSVAPGVGPAGVDGPIGYIRIATFNTQTAEAWKDALVAVRKAGATRIVMDIRNNGGGLFPAGVEVARSLVGTGDIVLIADANGTRDIYSATGVMSVIDGTTPLSVIVNQGTASASEVLAGSLQDNRRATIVGETPRTFGKGLIQTVVDLSDGSGITVTVAQYRTPLGTDINKVGIAPDLMVAPESLPLGLTTGDGKFCAAVGPGASAPPLLFK